MTTPLSGDELREFAGMSFMQAAAQVGKWSSLLSRWLLGARTSCLSLLEQDRLLQVCWNVLQAGSFSGTHAPLRNGQHASLHHLSCQDMQPGRRLHMRVMQGTSLVCRPLPKLLPTLRCMTKQLLLQRPAYPSSTRCKISPESSHFLQGSDLLACM